MFFCEYTSSRDTHNASRRAATLTFAGTKPRDASTARKTKKRSRAGHCPSRSSFLLRPSGSFYRSHLFMMLIFSVEIPGVSYTIISICAA